MPRTKLHNDAQLELTGALPTLVPREEIKLSKESIKIAEKRAGRSLKSKGIVPYADALPGEIVAIEPSTQSNTKVRYAVCCAYQILERGEFYFIATSQGSLIASTKEEERGVGHDDGYVFTYTDYMEQGAPVPARFAVIPKKLSLGALKKQKKDLVQAIADAPDRAAKAAELRREITGIDRQIERLKPPMEEPSERPKIKRKA
jgi:hypothetical protein